MKGCSMKRKSTGCDIRSLLGFARTRILGASSKSTALFASSAEKRSVVSDQTLAVN